jgi:hypothetical protein
MVKSIDHSGVSLESNPSLHPTPSRDTDWEEGVTAAGEVTYSDFAQSLLYSPPSPSIASTSTPPSLSFFFLSFFLPSSLVQMARLEILFSLNESEIFSIVLILITMGSYHMQVYTSLTSLSLSYSSLCADACIRVLMGYGRWGESS